jgi:hypothetical protein
MTCVCVCVCVCVNYRNIVSRVNVMLSASKGQRPFCTVPLHASGAVYVGSSTGIDGNLSGATPGGTPQEMFMKVELVLPQLAPGHLMLWSCATHCRHWFGHLPHTSCEGAGHICCAPPCCSSASPTINTSTRLQPPDCGVRSRALTRPRTGDSRHPALLHADLKRLVFESSSARLRRCGVWEPAALCSAPPRGWSVKKSLPLAWALGGVSSTPLLLLLPMLLPLPSSPSQLTWLFSHSSLRLFSGGSCSE